MTPNVAKPIRPESSIRKQWPNIAPVASSARPTEERDRSHA
jgi:hypothetical protein